MAETSVTIKSGKGYDDTWQVFRGESLKEVRDQIVEFFDMEVSGDLSLHSVVLEATRLAHGGAAPVKILGAKVEAEVKDGEKDPWAEAEKAEQKTEDPYAGLIAELGAAPDVEELRRIWQRNQDHFSEERVMEAYKARGKALTAA